MAFARLFDAVPAEQFAPQAPWASAAAVDWNMLRLVTLLAQFSVTYTCKWVRGVGHAVRLRVLYPGGGRTEGVVVWADGGGLTPLWS